MRHMMRMRKDDIRKSWSVPVFLSPVHAPAPRADTGITNDVTVCQQHVKTRQRFTRRLNVACMEIIFEVNAVGSTRAELNRP